MSFSCIYSQALRAAIPDCLCAVARCGQNSNAQKHVGCRFSGSFRWGKHSLGAINCPIWSVFSLTFSHVVMSLEICPSCFMGRLEAH